MGMLVQQLETVSVRLHHSAADLSPEELVERPLPGVNPIAFLIWHMARSQDWAVNTAIRDVPELIGGILEEIKKLAIEGMTMIVVTHEMGFAREVGDRLMFMDEGVIVEQGAAREMIKNPQNERTQAFLRAIL